MIAKLEQRFLMLSYFLGIMFTIGFVWYTNTHTELSLISLAVFGTGTIVSVWGYFEILNMVDEIDRRIMEKRHD